MSLHDQLLADLEDLDGLDSGGEEKTSTTTSSSTPTTTTVAQQQQQQPLGNTSTNAVSTTTTTTITSSTATNFNSFASSSSEAGASASTLHSSANGVGGPLTVTSVRDIAKVAHGPVLKRILSEIARHDSATSSSASFAVPAVPVIGPIEESPVYKLTVEANNLVVDIDTEIASVHNYVRGLYGKCFPELDQLVRDPYEYMQAVSLLGNDLASADVCLRPVLAPATVMVVTVTASTTRGTPLESDDVVRVREACAVGEQLRCAKADILRFVESKMALLAPNVAHICGALTAAKLLGVAGGLTALSKMPACNILLLGAQKRSAHGMSGTSALPHTGFIYYAALVQAQPVDFRRKAARLVAAKLALAARVDAFRKVENSGGSSSSNGSSMAAVATIGVTLRQEVERKIEKAQEAPELRAVKALPKPDDAKRKRRGGKRARRQRERYELTAAHKAANRMGFGEISEDIYQDESRAVGASGGGGGGGSGGGYVKGRLRATEVKQKGGALSKRMRKELNKPNNRGAGVATVLRGASALSGTASVAFSERHGLEIAAPVAAATVVKKDDKYFGTASTFRQVGDSLF
eukprot:UC1_evm1s813